MKWVNQYNIQSIYKLPEILRNGVKKLKRIITCTCYESESFGDNDAKRI